GALQLRIADARPLIASQPQRDLEHDIPRSVRALEPAVAIPEGTLPCGEGPALERGAVEAFHAHQTLGDLLPVGAHVLYRRAAAQDVCGQAALGRVCQRRADFVLGAALDEIAGFPSEPECGVRGEGNVFAQLHDSSSTLTSSVAAPRRGTRLPEACMKCTPCH